MQLKSAGNRDEFVFRVSKRTIEFTLNKQRKKRRQKIRKCKIVIKILNMNNFLD